MQFAKSTLLAFAMIFGVLLPTGAGAAVVMSYSGIVGGGGGPVFPAFFPGAPPSFFEMDPGQSGMNFGVNPIKNYGLGPVTALPSQLYFAPQSFVLTLTMPSAPISATGGLSHLFWSDFYQGTQGSLGMNGGTDNFCCAFGYTGLPLAIDGQSVTFSFTSQLFYSLGQSPFEYLANFDWAGPAFMDVVFSNDDYGLPYSITLSSVPEPSTWALLIMGFGMVGFSLRRQRRNLARGS